MIDLILKSILRRDMVIVINFNHPSKLVTNPIVVINEVVKESSEYLSNKQLFPTPKHTKDTTFRKYKISPESPMSNSFSKKSYFCTLVLDGLDIFLVKLKEMERLKSMNAKTQNFWISTMITATQREIIIILNRLLID